MLLIKLNPSSRTPAPRVAVAVFAELAELRGGRGWPVEQYERVDDSPGLLAQLLEAALVEADSLGVD